MMNDLHRLWKVVAEALIVFVGTAGVIGLFQDYFSIREPARIPADILMLKYFAAALSSVFHASLVARRT